MQPAPSAGKPVSFVQVSLEPDSSKKVFALIVVGVLYVLSSVKYVINLVLHIFILFISDVSSCIQVQKAFM